MVRWCALKHRPMRTLCARCSVDLGRTEFRSQAQQLLFAVRGERVVQRRCRNHGKACLAVPFGAVRLDGLNLCDVKIRQMSGPQEVGPEDACEGRSRNQRGYSGSNSFRCTTDGPAALPGTDASPC
jgi:hypothetical protein